jgi:hypothetical protein
LVAASTAAGGGDALSEARSESGMDITVTASTKKGEWALIDLLGREMGRIAETELGLFRIKPQGRAVATMAALTSKTYLSLDIALAAIEEHTRGVCRRV